MMTRKDGRANGQMRPAAIERGYALASACIIFISCSHDGVEHAAREDAAEQSVSIANETNSNGMKHLITYLDGIEQSVLDMQYLQEDTKNIVNELTNRKYDASKGDGDWWGETVAWHIHDLYDRRDPKTAPILVEYLCDPSLRVGGLIVRESVTNLGIYSVPYLIRYIDSENTGMWEIIELLEIISKNEPALMSGILKYVVIPKVETELSKPGEGSKFLKAHFSGHYTRLKELSLQLEESR